MNTYHKIVDLWKSYNITKPSDLDVYLHSFRILFAYHSGKIENDEITYHDTREIFENGKVSAYTGDPKALFEQQNQKMCYEFLKEEIIQKEPLSTSLIKEIHAILTAGTFDEVRYVEKGERAGEFKKHDYVTGINEVGSPPEQVEEDVLHLLEEVNGYSGTNTLKVASYFHARFEHIHPFADGNGRVGRTLLNYYLMVNDNPPLTVYEEDRRLYYECLETYDIKEEIDPLYNFFIYQTEKTWGNSLQLSKGETHEPQKGLTDFIL